MPFVKIEFRGETTEVDLSPCKRCKRVPTSTNAKVAVAHDFEKTRGCAVCGRRPKLYPKHALYHTRECKGGFILCGTGEPVDPFWQPDWAVVWSTGPAGTVDGVFHVACLKKVAPGVVIHNP